MTQPLKLLNLRTSGSPATETAACSLAKTFALQVNRFESQEREFQVLQSINNVLMKNRMGTLQTLSELGQETIIGRLLVYPELFKEVRRLMNLSIPLLDAVLDGVEKGQSLELAEEKLHSCDITPEQIAPYVKFAESYQRSWYSLSLKAEMLILCWSPGQKTEIHDHGKHRGIDMVYQGFMLEQRFAADEEGWVKETETLLHVPGETVLIGANLVHQASNPIESAKDLISIHMYINPLWRF